MKRYLLDTSIQIKRIVSEHWIEKKVDRIWDKYEPVVSGYTLMEFKNSLIAAVQYLISILEEIKDAHGEASEDIVAIRLNEVIIQLAVETKKYTGERRFKLATAIAAKTIDENKFYPRKRRVEEVIDQLKAYGEDLEEWFYFFPRNKKVYFAKKIDQVECFLAIYKSPIRDGLEGYRCKKNTNSCRMSQHSRENEMTTVIHGILEKSLNINSSRTKEGVKNLKKNIDNEKFIPYKSIGERLCWPVGDLVIVSTAKKNHLGIITLDKDQLSIAEYLDIDSIFINTDYKVFYRDKEAYSKPVIEDINCFKTLHNTKLGKILVSVGFILEEELDKALSEQRLRIGEILVQLGRITPQQLDNALDIQKENSIKLGKILNEMGYITHNDIDYTLHRMKRKLGEILMEMGFLKDSELHWALAQQAGNI